MKKLYLFVYIFSAVVFSFCFGLCGFIKCKYPVVYNSLIKKYSTQYNLDINLVRAIINQESKYNTLAKSNKGALGLMQIMPKTAMWIASENNFEDFYIEKLFEPKTNIMYGCIYLNYLFSNYKNEKDVLFAYNAGEGRLVEIKKSATYLDVESIEIKETQKFIYKVLDYKNKYEKLNRIFLYN